MSKTKKLSFALLMTVLFFMVFEGLLRLSLGPPIPDVQVYSYAGQPKDWLFETGMMVRPMYKHQPESFPIKPQGKRVAFLGGSTVHGGSPTVSYHQEFPALVGKKLGVKAWNLARPAIDSHDILSIVQELKEYHFDAWVIYTGHNDFGNTYFFERFRDWGARKQVGIQSVLQNLAIYRLLVQAQKRVGNGRSKGLGMSDFHGKGVTQAQKEHAQELLLQNIRRISFEAKQVGVPVVFIVPMDSWIRAPLGGCVKGEACAKKTHRKGLNMMRSGAVQAKEVLAQACAEDSIPLRILPQAQEALRTEFEELGVVYLDPHSTLSRESKIDLPAESLFFDHVHLTQKGHQELADAISKTLRPMITP